MADFQGAPRKPCIATRTIGTRGASDAAVFFLSFGVGTTDALAVGMLARRSILQFVVTLGTSLLARQTAFAQPAPAPAPARQPTWKRDEKDPRWVQGQVLALAPAEDVWTRLQRVPEWPTMFTDIKSLRVLERGTDHWRVRLETHTFDCGAHDYHVRFLTPRTARLWIDAPGVSALAYMRVLEGATAASSRVVYSLFIDAHGIVGWFVSKDDLRKKQESMVERYLADLEKTFSARPKQAA